jgi:hypothetical protein
MRWKAKPYLDSKSLTELLSMNSETKNIYNYDRAARSAERGPQSSFRTRCSSDVPGAWPSSDDSYDHTTKSWSESFFRPSPSPPRAWSPPQQQSQGGLRFVFEEYAARFRYRGPGISGNDIIKFVSSLPQPMNWLVDWGNQVGLAVLVSFF